MVKKWKLKRDRNAGLQQADQPTQLTRALDAEQLSKSKSRGHRQRVDLRKIK